MRIRQSVCYPAFRSEDVTLREFCTEVSKIGCEAIELWGWDESLDEIAKTAKECGLSIASMTGHESISKGLNDSLEHDRIEHELRRSIDKAHECGIPGIICFAGDRHPSRSDLEGLSTFITGIRRIVSYAESRGVTLNLEILNSRVDHPGYQCDRVDWAIAACTAVNSPNFKILFDIYHVQIMEGDIIRNLRKAMPHIGHIHTAGNPDRQELEHHQELNYRPIAEAIAATDYQGFVAHEFFPRSANKIQTLREAFDICNVS